MAAVLAFAARTRACLAAGKLGVGGSLLRCVSTSSTVDEGERAKFEAMGRAGSGWWDGSPWAAMAPLHKMNAARGTFVRRMLCDHFSRDETLLKPLQGLSVVDVGCGGGIFTETLARLGATALGIDATAEGVRAATKHSQLDPAISKYVSYKQSTSADVLREGGEGSFDAVVSLEVVEHVADVEQFVEECCRLCRPGGVVVMSTLSRTPQSLALAIVAAEKILRWVPHGTHDWKKFIKPEELTLLWKRHGVDPVIANGMEWDVLRSEWKLTSELYVDYIMAGVKSKL